MKFSDMPYERVDFEKVGKELSDLTRELEAAKSGEEQFAIHQRYYALTDHVNTLMTIGHIRHDINTVDEFYEKERKYYDEMGPVFQNQVLEYMQKLYESPYRDYLESKIGPVAFKNMEVAMKAFDERVIALSQEENALTTEYDQLIASAKIPFDGKELNLSLLRPYLVSPDREVRRQAWQKKTEFFLENAQKLDEIYDKLVKNRTAPPRPRPWAMRTTWSWDITVWAATAMGRKRWKVSADRSSSILCPLRRNCTSAAESVWVWRN